MTVQIVEIMGRATQGMTRPFICRADKRDRRYLIWATAKQLTLTPVIAAGIF